MVFRALVAASLCLLASLPASAHAERGPCVVGKPVPRCEIWTGTVGPVYDGDSIRVKIDGRRDGGSGQPAHVRLTGVQAMELSQYGRKRGRLGECTAVLATERLEQLVQASGRRVRLAALHPASVSGPRMRPRRNVAVRIDGHWIDAGALLIQEGLALWFPNSREWAWNARYSRLAEEAAARQAGIWDPEQCGRGPGQTLAPLRMKVKWNASGNDATNVNGEWVRITNTDPVDPVPLGGWWFRDSHLRRYRFPRNTVIPPGLSIKLHVGKGIDRAGTLYWGLDVPVFDNATGDHFQVGDGGYLFDPRGNLRAHVQYPCRMTCGEPLAGKLAVTAQRRNPEFVRLRNVSNETINLFEYELERAPWFYELGPDAVLLPGQRLDVYARRSALHGPPFARSWGWRTEFLPDKRGHVTVRNPLGAPIACQAWGGGRCPEV